MHSHKCKICRNEIECGNIDCKWGTVNFMLVKGLCSTCTSGTSILKTRLESNGSGLTEVYCPECGAVGKKMGPPKCNGEHPPKEIVEDDLPF